MGVWFSVQYQDRPTVNSLSGADMVGYDEPPFQKSCQNSAEESTFNREFSIVSCYW